MAEHLDQVRTHVLASTVIPEGGRRQCLSRTVPGGRSIAVTRSPMWSQSPRPDLLIRMVGVVHAEEYGPQTEGRRYLGANPLASLPRR